MASRLFRSSVFACASAALLGVNGPAHASDDEEYCSDKREKVETKEKTYEKEKSKSKEGSASKEEKTQEEARKALYKQSVSDWTYDCEEKVKCDDDDDDDHCPPVVSPSS